VTRYSVPPDGCIDILYDRANGLRAIGSMTAKQSFDLAEGAYLTGIRFRPGLARPFLGISAAELTDGSAPLDDLFPRRARELMRKLDDAPSIQEAMRRMQAEFQAPAHPLNSVQRAISEMAALNGKACLETVASHARLNLRQFRRRCLEESGLTPKFLSRILRFRHARRCASKTGKPDWARIAAEAGYFDQAHLIRDFQSFTGLTPVADFSNTRSRCTE